MRDSHIIGNHLIRDVKVHMPNPHRGEIEALLDGTPFNLVLTLGALAELEQAFGHDDMLSLAERFQSGRLSAVDAQRIIGAGLRGAGHEILDEAVGRMRAEGGAAGFVDIVARLLGATFGSHAGSAATRAASAEGRPSPAPFLGTP
jgi:Phage tail tube protein, GTA-gp10